jgi:hypothetical protein
MRFAECVPAHPFTSTPGSSSPTTCTVCGRCRKTTPIFRVGGERSRPGSRNRCRSASRDHPVMTRRGERGIWQRRYWEHTIRDDRDFAAHVDYTDFNPAPTLPSPASGGGLGRGLTRRTGRTRHFAGASPAECIPPTGGAAAINRNRLANGSEIEAAEAGRGHGRSISRTPILKSRRNALRCSALRLLLRLSAQRPRRATARSRLLPLRCLNQRLRPMQEHLWKSKS